ncbi:MAG: tetratricopeptide repeat protein [Elusimicrobia bacterium]|nr:tetratricopeptide repeat protein [Elusimicrobiota bacterium]
MFRFAPHPGPRVRLAAHLSVLALVWWTASAATSLRLPPLGAVEARSVADAFEENRRIGEFRKALAGVRRLLKSYPDRPEYLQAEAELLTHLSDPAGAAASWEAFMAVAPFPADACPHIGSAYSAAKAPEKSLEAHRRCYESDPSQVDMAISYARALMDANKLSEAEKLFEEAMVTWPDNKDPRMGLLQLRFKQGRTAEVEEILALIRKSGDRDTDALYIAYRLAKDRGDRAAAKAHLREAIQLSPSYEDLYRNLAELQEADREWPAALKTYKTLLELEPDNARVRKRIRELEDL